MGKKSKDKRTKQTPNETFGKPTVQELVDMQSFVKAILEKASKPIKGPKEEWENYLEVHQLVSNLRSMQSGYGLKRSPRNEKVEAFIAWMKDNGVDTSAVAVSDFKEGLGLKANKTIQMNELFLNIPRKVMMTVETAKASVLGKFIQEDRVLLMMSNVSLSLHVLCEAYSLESFWKPYLDILPESYTTPLYFSPDDVEFLKGSPLLGDILNQFRSIARQYAYFFKLFQESTNIKLPFDLFTYDDYRWAVSTVMTRQNQIPASESNSLVLALIPLWDMCNHTEGQFTTDFNVEKQCGECYALREFDADQQVYIYYGPRSNADFLLNNGFVYPANPSDRLEIKLGFSKTDPMYTKRCDLLSKLSLLPSERFHLHKGEDPLDSELLAYMRVFHMTEEELDNRLESGSREQIGMLRDFGEVVSEENERKLWGFLNTRCKLLLRAYTQTIKDDRELLQGDTLTDTQRLAVQQRYMEKNILQSTLEFIDRYLQELEIKLQEQKVEALKIADRENRIAKRKEEEVATGSAQPVCDDDDDIDMDSIAALDQK